MNKILIVALSIAMFPMIALAEITPADVAAKMQAGDVQTAETFTREIIKNHPKSAKAHYYLGQILAQQGKYKPAYAELNEAADLDKTLTFAANPERFRQEMDKVKVNLGRAEAPPVSDVKDTGWGWFTWLLILSGFGGAIWFFFFKKPEEKAQQKEPARNHPSYASNGLGNDYRSNRSQGSQQTYRPAASAPVQQQALSPSAPHVVNSYGGGSNDGLMTGLILGEMMSGGHRNESVTNNTTVIERETTNNNSAPSNNFDAGSSVSNTDSSFDAGSNDNSKSDFDSGSSDSFDSGSDDSSSFDSGSSSFDSGSGGGDSSW